MDALEPGGYVRDECHVRPQLRGDLPFMNMVCQAVGDDIVGEVLDVIFGAGLRAGAAVA